MSPDARNWRLYAEDIVEACARYSATTKLRELTAAVRRLLECPDGDSR